MPIQKVLAMCAVLGALTAQPAASDPPEQKAVDNQPFYPSGYIDLKVASKMARSDFPAEPGMIDFVLPDCKLSIVTADNPKDQILEYTARTVETLANQLAARKYTTEIYSEPLLNYERGMIDLSSEAPTGFDIRQWPPAAGFRPFITKIGAIQYDLFVSLEERRQVLQPNSSPIIYQGCPAGSVGETPYVIRTAPKKGRVWMVPMFRFYVCSSSLADAWDVNSCRWWREHHPGEKSHVSGRHKYQARWPDGRSARGDKTFDPQGEKPITVTIVPND